ncbi:hypothetical protein DMC14_001370 [Metamycoplasma phocicerebrale]|uniref:TNase-like domain-containing protein n=1 Tax=Metamycoplasma phocicerebrale TaxID=142649 RepID=A0A3Q9V9C6_9BACT|nr:thermonuclease family protein [Metamycoplasma phocicerebrale]AZZ65437.1 hypothetical protein DMC14_001370 [Metamycoplasma phocicerebrale]
MKKKILIFSLIPLLTISSVGLVQCANTYSIDSLKKYNDIKNLEIKSYSILMESKIIEEANSIKSKPISNFYNEQGNKHLEIVLKLLKMVESKSINEISLSSTDSKINEKIQIINEITETLINKDNFIDNKVLAEYLIEYFYLRTSITNKKIHDEESFNEIIKKAIILAKKLRNLISQEYENLSPTQKDEYKNNHPNYKFIDNKISNSDLDKILNIEPISPDDDKPKPDDDKPNPEEDEQQEPNKISWIDKKNNQLILNKYIYKFSNEFKVMHATRVITLEKKDGDTTVFKNKNNNEYGKFRYSGVDTPETWKKVNGQFVPTDGLQLKYGTMAKNFTSKNLDEAKEIWVIPQKTISDYNKETNKEYYDHYGRIVGIIVVVNQKDEVFCLNEQLIFNGFAKVSYISLDKNSKYYTINENYYHWIKDSEKEARNNNKGIWGDDIKQIYPKKN